MLKVGSKKLRWADINMAQIDLDKLVLHFSQCMRAEGKSPKTITWYGEMISSFIRFLKSTGKSPILNEFNLTNARDFVIYEQQRRVSPSTVQCRVRSLKGFSSWLFGEGYLTDNVLAQLKTPKAPIKVIELLVTEEIDLLVSAISTYNRMWTSGRMLIHNK